VTGVAANTFRPSDLLSLRSRWARLSGGGSAPAGTTVRLLASYTIDPLVPYLGVRLHDADLPADLSVGPYHQILQQCLDDTSDTGRLRPAVLVVAPRLEDYAADGGARDLVHLADVALAAAARWRSCLVFVLPAVPEQRPYGVGDGGRRTGTAATAAAVRERLRAVFSGRPNVLLADAEEAVRAVGARSAHRPAMYRFARVPYAEAVFDQLAQQLAGLLRLRHGNGQRAVVLDTAGLGAEGLAELRRPLDLMRRRGTRLAIRAAEPTAELGPVLAEALPELLADARVALVADDRPLADQLASVVRHFAVPTASMALLTSVSAPLDAGAAEVVVLGEEPADWASDLAAAGLLDALPAPEGSVRSPEGSVPAPDGETGAVAEPVAGARTEVSLAEFIAGLDVGVTFQDVDRALDGSTAELVARAHDFTLGENRPPHSSGPGFAVAANVTDRLGDYGTSAVAAVHHANGVAGVDVFSVSCPALGRGVEDRVLQEIVARADRDGCHTVRIEYEETGRNQVAVNFLHAAAERTWNAPSGREMRIVIARTEADR
jgi:FkbH-like protein